MFLEDLLVMLRQRHGTPMTIPQMSVIFKKPASIIFKLIDSNPEYFNQHALKGNQLYYTAKDKIDLNLRILSKMINQNGNQWLSVDEMVKKFCLFGQNDDVQTIINTNLYVFLSQTGEDKTTRYCLREK
jgi:hypothetical protein